MVPFKKEEYSFKIGFYLIQHELSRSNPIVRAVKQTVLENIEELLKGTNFVAASSYKKELNFIYNLLLDNSHTLIVYEQRNR